MNYAKTILVGHLCNDWETRYSQSGSAISKCRIAVNRRYKDKDEVSFFTVTAFGERGNTLAKYTHKGDPILLECEPVESRWEADGKRMSRVEFNVWNFTFLGKKPEHRDEHGKRQEQSEVEAPF